MELATFWLPTSIISLSYPLACDPTIAKLAIFNVNNKYPFNINSMPFDIVKVCLRIYIEICPWISVNSKNKHICIGKLTAVYVYSCIHKIFNISLSLFLLIFGRLAVPARE